MYAPSIHLSQEEDVLVKFGLNIELNLFCMQMNNYYLVIV